MQGLQRSILLVMTWMLLGRVASAATVCAIKIDTAIGPATSGYIERAINEAAEQNAQCLIIHLDTPGGLLDSTKQIVQDMLSSPVPIVVYVSPHGATATSAGCFITLAADVAAMAPATTIGAAHPVLSGGAPQQPQMDDTMKQKIENYAVSYIEAVASRRNRNIEWARSSVKDSASITAEKALELNVIEIIAQDRADLLRQLNGRQVAGKTLATADATVIEIPPSPRERLFQVLWRPEIMFLLMLIAMYGIIGELSNPGAILPGVVGVIALVLALYMAAILPVNVAGLALIGVSLGLFVIDIFAPTHGVLTVGGIISFFLGALMMFDRTEPMLRMSLGVIVPATVVTALFFIFVAGAGLRAQYWPKKVGVETLLGKVVPAVSPIDALGGKVFIEGEYWDAISDVAVAKDAPVEVIAVDRMKLRVKPRQS